MSVHDSANSFGNAGKAHFRKAHSQGAQPARSNHNREANKASSSGRHTGTVQAAHPEPRTMHTAQHADKAQHAQHAQHAQTDAQDAKLGTWANRQIRFPWPRKTADLFDSAGSRNGTATTTDVGSPSAVSTPTNIPGEDRIFFRQLLAYACIWLFLPIRGC